MNRILTLTLNPAIDLTTGTEVLEAGPKLRCDPPVVEPGGGGVNVSRMIRILGGESTALVAVGGPTGDWLQALLTGEGLDCHFVSACGDTRLSFAVHAHLARQQYRFVLPGPAQDAAFAERVKQALTARLHAARHACVVASGSLPPGLRAGFYAELGAIAAAHGAAFVLDTSGPALAAGLGAHVSVVKPNDLEARALAASLGLDPDDDLALGRHLVATGKARAAVLTRAAAGAVLVTAAGVRQVRPPPVPVLSKVGAGDSFVGALVHGMAGGMTIEAAFEWGVAAAAAAVMTPASELARREDVLRIHAALQRG